MTAAVEITGVTKRFDDVVAVDDIDLTIADGEFFAMLGPSGCGKTTTLRMIAGLEFPTEGSLQIFGEEVGTLPPNKRPVNTVFQNYALFPHMNLLENVGFGLKMKGVAKQEATQRALAAIELVQLGGMEKRRPNQLSGGQQQRVALARAFACSPKILFADEPTGNLDQATGLKISDLLFELNQESDTTLVLVTHEQRLAERCESIITIDDGRLASKV